MTSWYSQLLTTTSSRITNLQRTLLASEADGDTEDDTHVCRVLRNYYVEKGRPFPPWLPPDPKAPPPAAPVYSQQVGSRYGGLAPQQGNTGLSSLWDNNAVGGRQDPQSLRQGRGMPPPMRSEPAVATSRNPFSRGPGGGGSGGDPRDEIQARPLPSQRAGSYQSNNSYGRDSTSSVPPSSSSGGGGGGSAQAKLKQRLWGGARTTSPSSSGPFQPPQQQQPLSQGRYGGGADNYEDRFAPGGMYDSPSRGGGGGRSNQPDYGGGGRVGGGGLPGGPRRGGLPSGPRMR